jgi:alcohol dehydrogenase
VRSPTPPWAIVFTSIRGSPAGCVRIAARASRCCAALLPSKAISVFFLIRRVSSWIIRLAVFRSTPLHPRSGWCILPPRVTFDQAARFGYLGTSYAALRLGQVRGGSWVAINGITGTLGVGATLLALAMGATRILGLGRNRDVLAQLKALAPDRIEVLALGDAPIAAWMQRHTEELGVDVLIDCSARSAAAANTAEALAGLKRGAIAVNIGALTEPLAIQPIRFMTARLQFRGSNWFTTGEGQSMAEMAQVGMLDLTKLATRAYPLAKINEALAEVQTRPGGFVNIVVHPDH